MKKTLLSLLFVQIMFAATSQIVEFVNPVDVYYGTSSNSSEIIEANWDVVNISGSTIEIGCKIIINQNVTGAEHQFCWGLGCSAWLTTNNTLSEVVTLDDGETSSSFHGKYRHNGFAGQSKVNYCWFNTATSFTSFCYEVDYCVDAECITSVNEAVPAASIEMMTPNPVSNVGAINYHFTSAPQSGKFTIYNALGGIVREVQLEKKNGTIFIGATELENGIYFCSIEDQGKVYQTQRFIVSK